MNEIYFPKDLEGKLARVTEECGEVLQIIGKIGRFGYQSYNPLVPVSEQQPNWKLLRYELIDLQHAIEQYVEHADKTFDQ